MEHTDYPIHSVKQDEQSGIIAQRTGFSDAERAWRVYRPDGVSHVVAHADVAAWADLVKAT